MLNESGHGGSEHGPVDEKKTTATYANSSYELKPVRKTGMG